LSTTITSPLFLFFFLITLYVHQGQSAIMTFTAATKSRKKIGQVEILRVDMGDGD
jgi:hypothetical protein